jgi:fructose-1,6-bisphosphatase/inositol monophosphatase family enzyme/predicted Zn-dependent protease
MLHLKALENVALELARAMAEVGLSYFKGNLEITRKRDRSLVSLADRNIEWAARSFLAKATPEFGFLGEETGKIKKLGEAKISSADESGAAILPNENFYPRDFVLPPELHEYEKDLNTAPPEPLVLNEDTYWMIDPIDGTINFLAKSPLWSTLIALVHKGKPVLGLVSLPSLGEVFIASKGNGARYGSLEAGLANLRPCQVKSESPLSRAHISCSSPRTFMVRGVDGFFQELVQSSEELRTHSDAYGYTRVLCGGIDAMIDPIVAPYDVAALQVLFDETPQACFGTLHGFQGEGRHRMGSAIGASSAALCEEIQLKYQNWLLRQPDFALTALPSSLSAFSREMRLPFDRTPAEFPLGAQCALALEKGVASFLHRLGGKQVCIEDVSFLASVEESLQASVKNGFLPNPVQSETTLGLHVRAVVAGGTGLRTVSLPYLQPLHALVAEALQEAWTQSQEQKCDPLAEILAWRDPHIGHFGNAPWDQELDRELFAQSLEYLREQKENLKEEIQAVSSSVTLSVEKRLQIFLDGSAQTQARQDYSLRGSVVARRADEKRRVSARLSEGKNLSWPQLQAAFEKELKWAKNQARALLSAPLLPEELPYSYLAVDADLLGLILHEAVGHAAEGDLIFLGGSGFGGKKGDGKTENSRESSNLESELCRLQGYQLKEEKVAADWIDIVIDGALDNCGHLGIDCEGTLPVRKTLVRQGKLVDSIHTRQTARQAGRTPDGCARQEGIFHNSFNRMTSIWVQARNIRPLPLLTEQERIDRPSAESVQALLEKDGFLRKGERVLFLSGWKGGTATGSNLEFRADVAFVHVLEKGKKPVLMREANFTGIATECFLSAVAAYGPVLCRTIGTCGKDGQGVPTSDGGPAVFVLEKNPRVAVIGSGDADA